MPRHAFIGKVRILTLAIAFLALALVIASGPGTKAGWWSWQVAVGLVAFAFLLGAAAAFSALGLLVLHAFPAFRASLWVPLTALAVGVIAVIPPLLMLWQAKSVPEIHDITTDTADPPAFVALLEARRKSPNGFAYERAQVAADQARGYPDIKPLVSATGPRDMMQKAIDAARSMGWEIAASDAASGRMEATDTSSWFGFKDDVVVRIRPEGAGSKVDVRSMSRVGSSDLGANAARIRKFLGKLS